MRQLRRILPASEGLIRSSGLPQVRPLTDLRHVFIRSVQSIDCPFRYSQFDRQNPLLVPLLSQMCGGILISGVVRLVCCVCLSIGHFSRLGFIMGLPVNASVTCNWYLFASCSQLHSHEFRVVSVWAGKDSLLSLEEGTYTLINRTVQALKCYMSGSQLGSSIATAKAVRTLC